MIEASHIMIFYTVILIILVALIFDFYNGLNDAANSVATIVSTRVLTPHKAVIWAASFNFLAAFGFGVHVATTIGKGIILPEIVTPTVILSALLGAIIWNIFAHRNGLPISVSHSLVGGLIGAGISASGFASIAGSKIVTTFLFIFLAPMLGFVFSLIVSVIVLNIVKKKQPRQVDKYFRKLQLISAAAYSLGHGTNDAQKTMGIIAVLLFTTGYLGTEFYVPFWVIIISHAAIALGTYFGGWKVIRTMGMKITKLEPYQGFCAETSSALMLIGTAQAGIPVSTTHTIAGAIMGTGSTKRLSAVRWGVARTLIWAWVLTIPVCLSISFTAFQLLSIITGFIPT